MRSALIMLLFISSCFAADCSEVGVELWGEVVYLKGINEKKEKASEIKKTIQRNPVPKAWNVNSDRFESLFLKYNPKKHKIDSIQFAISSKKNPKFKTIRKYKLSNINGNSRGLAFLKGASFKEDLIPPMNLFPATMKMKALRKGGKEICSQEFKFEVVK